MLGLFAPPSTTVPPPLTPRCAPVAAAQPPSKAYAGPERRNAAGGLFWNWLAAAFDEIDYGVLLLDADNRLMHMNHTAQVELDDAHPLQVQGQELRARHPGDASVLAAALQGAARRGLRKLLTVGEGAQRTSMSVVPLSPLQSRTGLGATLVMLSKRQVCVSLSVQGFARTHGLTSAELRVLAALCAGSRPSEAAVALGVQVSTVRTQIGSIRQKTGAHSIHELVRQVCVLPPLMGVLRSPPRGTGATLNA